MIRVVVVEDEPLARQYLCSLIAGTGKAEVIGEAGNGRDGLRVCAERSPDAAFLDIRIPGPDGLSLASRLRMLPNPPLVVFVTGFEGHAVDAFRVEAVDYLLKPIDAPGVLAAVRRLEHRLMSSAEPRPGGGSEPGNRLPVRGRPDEGVHLVMRRDVVAAVRRSRRTWVHTADEEFAAGYPLASVARWLGGMPFLRIARDAVVNMDAVDAIFRRGDRQYQVRLADRRRTLLEASRSGSALLAAYLRPPDR